MQQFDSADEYVILVDETDTSIGTEEKLSAHLNDQLHRAISVFVFDSRGRMLIQQRALDKYHSAGLWSNTCCSHPRPGEKAKDAAHRRLEEEMGFDCPLTFGFKFTYRAELLPGLFEHELDHVWIGQFDGTPRPNPDEVAAFKWIEPELLLADIERHPERYSFWFRLIVQRVLDAYSSLGV